MVSRKYNSYKFLYDIDDRNVFDVNDSYQLIKVQRIYKDNVTLEELTPRTPLFVEREVQDSFKVDKSDTDMRHVLVCKEPVDNPGNSSNFKTYIPYAPSDPKLKQHIEEIMTYNKVLTGSYHGESQEYK